MGLISIRNFLGQGKAKPEHYVRVLQLLLQGIALHARESEPDELGQFRSELTTLASQMSEQSAPEELLKAVGVANTALSEYNRQSEESAKAYLRELQTMLVMTTETVAFLGASSKNSVNQLHSLEKHMEGAVGLDNVRELKGQLTSCLSKVREESARVREEAQTRIALLMEKVEQTTENLRSVKNFLSEDPLTGLPGRRDGTQALVAALLSDKEHCVTLFLIDRLSSINMRFGRTAGDVVLTEVAQHLIKSLAKTGAALFRWNGPAFVAIEEMKAALPMVERRMKQVASIRLDKTMETEGRSVLLRVSCSFLVQKISGDDTEESLIRNLDRFVAIHAGATDAK